MATGSNSGYCRNLSIVKGSLLFLLLGHVLKVAFQYRQ